MAFLVPLLLPSVINATANVALGVTNALQGTSSNVSIKIGNKVFTTNEPFPFHRLPPEIRREIVLMALELSRSLILPPIVLSGPMQPFGPHIVSVRQEDLEKYNPLNPDNPNYRSIVGEMVQANGYPLSSWRWTGLNREWRNILRGELWRRCVVGGRDPYRHLLNMMKDPRFDLFTFTHHLELHQGFDDPTALYTIMRHPQLTHLETLAILPNYPFTSTPYEDLLPPFEFGLQLIPTPTGNEHRLKHFELGLPIEVCTNRVQRQHLAALEVASLRVTMLRPTVEMVDELAGLVKATTDTIHLRYVTISLRPLIDPTVFFSPSLEEFPNVVLHLPRFASSLHRHPYAGQTDMQTSFAQRIIDVITSDQVKQERYTVWIEDEVGAFDVTGRRKEELLWKAIPRMGEDATDEFTKESTSTQGGDSTWQGEVNSSNMEEKGKKKAESWERETNLRLFGGLVSLRMESKKH